MKLTSQTDTIVALATPPGEGGLSVIRVSGPESLRIASRGFQGKIMLIDALTHTAHFGRFVGADGLLLDEVVAVVFRGPHSYTGEDTVELSCHGGILVSKRVIETLVSYEARLALPGEFTKRAFLNGKIDLSQAEAVADLIHSKSEAAHRSSLDQLEGALSSRVQKLRNQLLEAVSLFELELDFAEEGFEFTNKPEVKQSLANAIDEIRRLCSTYDIGRNYREGIKVVLVGAPNAGKSSLLNALLNDNRAIVTDIAGTTRDVIEEQISLKGLLFRIVDTAGLRQSNDVIEQEGIRRTEVQAGTGDILLFVIDISRNPDESEKLAILDFVNHKSPAGASKIAVLNKVDLVPGLNGEIRERTRFLGDIPNVKLSALTLQGFDDLKELLMRSAGIEGISEGGVTITNIRHFQALNNTKGSLEMALASLQQRKSGEFVAVDLRRALDSLGEITGEVTTDEILNNIFSKFCIGK